MSSKYCMVITTVGSQEEANKLSEILVRKKLAACVQSMPITSTYIWQDQLTRESEWLMMIKTKSEEYKDIEAAILTLHSYDTPEILQLAVKSGSSAYLAWIDANTA